MRDLQKGFIQTKPSSNVSASTHYRPQIKELEWNETRSRNMKMRWITRMVLSTALGLAQGCQIQVDDSVIQQLNGGGAQTPTPIPTKNWTTFTAGVGTTQYRNRGSISNVGYGFIEYLPQGYNTAPTQYFPLVIFLHGLGEIGSGLYDPNNDPTVSDLDKLRSRVGTAGGPQYQIDRGKYYNAVVLTPQVTSGGWWNSGEIEKLIVWAMAHYKVDPKRLLITGLSMGGGGTWDYITYYSHKVAAAMPICGASGCSVTTGQGVVSDKVKIWSFHAMDDSTVTYSANSVSCMNKIGVELGQTATFTTNYNSANGAEQTARFDSSTKTWKFETQVDCTSDVCQTVYQTGGHNIWGKVYQHATQLPMTWLLNQSK